MYIDDLLIAAESAEECERQMRVAMAVIRAVGLTVAESKTEGPAHVLDFLGVDVVDGRELRISDKRLRHVRERMQAMLAAGETTLVKLRELTAMVSWFCLYLPQTRAWIRRMWDQVAVMPEVGAVPLSAGAKLDMR